MVAQHCQAFFMVQKAIFVFIIHFIIEIKSEFKMTYCPALASVFKLKNNNKKTK